MNGSAPDDEPHESGCGRTVLAYSAHAARLRRGFGEGVAAHGALPLAFETFARRAVALTVRRLSRGGEPPSGDDVGAALDRAALGDLYLAVACEEGVAGAWERLVAAFGSVLVAMALRRGASRSEAEEIARELPGELFTPPPGGGARSRIGAFDGAGSLTGWLAVIVQRRLADRRRAAVRSGADPDPSTASGGPGPASLAAGAEAGRRVAEAISEAWRSLTPREALALLLLHRDGLPQTHIARLLGVGEPRVSRIVGAATGKIRECVVRRLGAGQLRDRDDAEATWVALRRAVSDSLATLPGSPDSLSDV